MRRLLELYKKIRPGEPLTVESAESLITAMFFDPRRYDLAKVGRYKFNKKLMLRNRINGHVLAEDVVDVSTGEIIAEAGTEVTRSLADEIQNAAVPYVWIQTETRNVKVLSSMMVDLRSFVDCRIRRSWCYRAGILSGTAADPGGISGRGGQNRGNSKRDICMT